MFVGTAQAQSLCSLAFGPTDPLGTAMSCADAYLGVNAYNNDPGSDGLAYAVVHDDATGQPFAPPNCPPGSAAGGGKCIGAGAGSPGYSPPLVPGGAPASPIAPAASPFTAGRVLAAATIGLAALGGLLLGLGTAPVVVPAVILAAALHTGIMTVNASAPKPATAQAAVEAPNPPLTVKLQAAPTDAPAPEVGDSSPPSIVTNPNGQFVPGGGGAFDSGNGASGGWAPSTGGATGEWQYTPPATAANPTPAPTAAITQGGYATTQQLAPNASGSANGSLTVERASDGSVVVTQAATVQASTGSGAPTTIDAATSTPYLPNGNPAPGGGGVAVGSTLGNGAPSNGGQGISVAGATSGTGATPESTNAGGCGSGGTCETTQLANKGLLTAIYDWLSGPGTAPDKPTAKTAAEIKTVSAAGSGGPFGDLLAWTLPAHESTCPSGAFEWNGNTYTIDAHCQLILDHFGVIRTVLTAVFAMSAIFHVLRA